LLSGYAQHPSPKPAVNPQGPIFPVQEPINADVPAPIQNQKKTSVPMSAIMGEVRAAKKIKREPAVLKVKNPAITIKDSLNDEYSLIKEGTYCVGLENEIVNISAPFTLAKYPVTKKQFFEFLKASDTEYSSHELNSLNKISPHPNCPAVLVSWEDAKNYCRWLRKTTGDYYALPSINEWEIAARGKDGRTYPWGEEEPNSNICCFNDGIMEPQSTASVDYFTENISPFGCVGMIGNVMEWTLDGFDDEREPHILKGGGWVSPIDFCNNVTPCMLFPPTKRQEFVGFRILFLPRELYKAYRDALINP
jgi:formylglycine-generating enzyme required for sulfatase activity